MAIDTPHERRPGGIFNVTIGDKETAVTVGGETTLPCLFDEGRMPHTPEGGGVPSDRQSHMPRIAFEVWDIPPVDWPPELMKTYGISIREPLAWARECAVRYRADMLCVRIQGAHPDYGNRPAAGEARFISELLQTVKLPLIIAGCNDPQKDNEVLPACSEAARGRRCLIGSAQQDNYKTLVAAALADGHSVIAESPIDINIAKQLNILISDMGLPLERIVMDPTIGALGYGLEYAYSIMERARLAALGGDKTLAMPFICFVGQETWRTKEALVPAAESPAWGAENERGIAWESVTAAALLQAGADILVMRHPAAIGKVKKYIDELWTP